ncbi:MAG: TRAM domain-containing protein [Syntrophomonadaceae bacterium]|nr:TRAM domain-containing protein [Syntrophomonadaceae bacterium]
MHWNNIFSRKSLFIAAIVFGFWIIYASQLFITLGLVEKLALGAAAVLLFYFFSNWCLTIFKWCLKGFNSFLDNTAIEVLLGGTAGLIAGIFVGVLSGYPLSMVPGTGGYLTLAVFVLSSCLGLKIGTRCAYDVFRVFSSSTSDGDVEHSHKAGLSPKVLDTSAIIDGRVYDVCLSKFLEGMLIVPNFVIGELQHIADSSDYIRRNKGRRGLELLAKMQKHPEIKINIVEADVFDEKEVDAKLIRLCKQINASIITNDYNLNKVAELQGITVLNINELANAVKMIVYPGETMHISIIKEGKEAGQGIGYLDDGTMVVVENAHDEIGNDLEVTVTSIFQTAAGRMIFTRKTKEGNESSVDGSIQGMQEVNLYG